MLIRNLDEVDALYVLLLGRTPENQAVRQQYLGTDVERAVTSFVSSDEFERVILTR